MLAAPVERSPVVRPLLVVVGWHVVFAALIVVGAIYLGVISQGSDCGSCPGGPLATILILLVVGPWLVPLLLASTAVVAGLGLAARWLAWLPMAAAIVVPPALFAAVIAPYLT